MPVFWLMFLSLPGVGILLGSGVMYLVSELVALDLAGFLAGVLALNLLLDLALVRYQHRGLGAPTAHEPVGRIARVRHVDDAARPVQARVMLDGIRWRALSEEPLEDGGRVRVTRRDGLTLYVTPLEPGEAE